MEQIELSDLRVNVAPDWPVLWDGLRYPQVTTAIMARLDYPELVSLQSAVPKAFSVQTKAMERIEKRLREKNLRAETISEVAGAREEVKIILPINFKFHRANQGTVRKLAYCLQNTVFCIFLAGSTLS